MGWKDGWKSPTSGGLCVDNGIQRQPDRQAPAKKRDRGIDQVSKGNKMTKRKPNQSAGIQQFNKQNFRKICDKLASSDDDLSMILRTHHYPPMWTRPNTFETLVH